MKNRSDCFGIASIMAVFDRNVPYAVLSIRLVGFVPTASSKFVRPLLLVSFYSSKLVIAIFFLPPSSVQGQLEIFPTLGSIVSFRSKPTCCERATLLREANRKSQQKLSSVVKNGGKTGT